MMHPKPLVGVSGWLAFFIIALCVLGPFQAISNTMMEFQALESAHAGASALDSWQNYKLGAWILIGFSVALRLVAGILLTSVHKPFSVHFTIAVLWITPVVTSIGTYVLVNMFFGSDAATGSQEGVFSELIVGLTIATIWTAYLLKSVRVKNTYFGYRP